MTTSTHGSDTPAPAPAGGRSWLTGTAAAFALSLVITIVIAWPVVTHPTERILGTEIVGRHHDPFTVMRQMAERGPALPYVQPATDWFGWLLARVLSPVAAFNLIVLWTFPFTAAATFALGRYLFLPAGAALVAALAFTFAPLHLAHAGYHPHIAQTQWLPLFFLALFAMVDRPSPARASALAAAAGALSLSNFYGGLIGAVLAPVALAAYSVFTVRTTRRLRNATLTAAALAGFAAVCVMAVAVFAPDVWRSASAFGFPASDVTQFSARWWAYFVPPVEHAVFGERAARIFASNDVTVALVENQVYVSAALLALALGAVVAAAVASSARPFAKPLAAVAIVGLAAAVVSIGPAGSTCEGGVWAPACGLHAMLPMFRSYARFAFVVHLAVALLAGAAVTWLTGSTAPRHKAMAVILVAFVAVEYWPLPWRSHDVLPTHAHRWLAGQPGVMKTLDCVPPSAPDAETAWLMGREIAFLNPGLSSCRDPQLASALAALGYTHVLARRHGTIWPMLSETPDGLRLLADFPDSRAFGVVAPVPAVAVTAAFGFHDFEHKDADIWRWLGTDGRWIVRNTTAQRRTATLQIVLESAGWGRMLDVGLDNTRIASLQVDPIALAHIIGPMDLGPGDHVMTFRPDRRPLRPADEGRSTDTRDLTVAFRSPRWVSE